MKAIVVKKENKMSYKFKIEELDPHPMGPISLFLFRFLFGFTTFVMATAIAEQQIGMLIVSIINMGLIIMVLGEYGYDVQRIKESEKNHGSIR